MSHPEAVAPLLARHSTTFGPAYEQRLKDVFHEPFDRKHFRTPEAQYNEAYDTRRKYSNAIENIDGLSVEILFAESLYQPPSSEDLVLEILTKLGDKEIKNAYPSHKIFDPLFYAARAGFSAVVQAMLRALGDEAKAACQQAHAHAERADFADAVQTPFHVLGDDAKATQQQIPDDDWTPLHEAASTGSADTVQAMLQALKDQATTACQRMSTLHRRSPLHEAASAGSAAAVKAILKALGPDDAKIACQRIDNNGHTPLHCAVIAGNLEAIKMILEPLSNREAILACRQGDDSGRAPLDLAASGDSADVIYALLKILGDPATIACRWTDHSQYTLLQRAAGAGSAAVFNAILKVLGPDDAKIACQQPDPHK